MDGTSMHALCQHSAHNILPLFQNVISFTSHCVSIAQASRHSCRVSRAARPFVVNIGMRARASLFSPCHSALCKWLASGPWQIHHLIFPMQILFRSVIYCLLKMVLSSMGAGRYSSYALSIR